MNTNEILITTINGQQIKELASDWAIDYKPWQDGMAPFEYARHGYEQGYKRAVQDMALNIVKKHIEI